LARQAADKYRQALAADPYGTKTRFSAASEPSRTRRNDAARPIARNLCLGPLVDSQLHPGEQMVLPANYKNLVSDAPEPA
jgi:hypothetical protein